jgi:hypothetical protein
MPNAECIGDPLPPLVSAECEAECYLRGVLDVRCEPGRLDVALDGAAPEEARALRTALEHAGARLTVAEPRAQKLALAAGTVAGAMAELRTVAQEIAQKGGDPVTRVRVAAKIGACLTPAADEARTTATRIESSSRAAASVLGAVRSLREAARAP